MQAVNVQFADSTQAVIISYFGSPQDATIYPNQGTVETDDTRWATFYGKFPPDVQSGLPTPT